MVDFWKSSSKVCKQPFIGLFKNPPEFSPAGENSVPRQGFKAFNLKAKFTDSLNILRKIYARFTQDLRRMLYLSVSITLRLDLSEGFALSSNGFITYSGQNFASQRGNSGGFCRGRKGDACIPLSPRQKSTKVLPQAKCRGIRRYFRSFPKSSLKGAFPHLR